MKEGVIGSIFQSFQVDVSNCLINRKRKGQKGRRNKVEWIAEREERQRRQIDWQIK